MKDEASCDIAYAKVFTDVPTDGMPTMMCNGREYVVNAFTVDCKPYDLQELLTNGDIIEIGAYSDGEKVYFLEINLHKIMNDFLFR